ncbi:MAG: hypothetical protein P8170_24730 [Gemmatimonadota bacterium]
MGYLMVRTGRLTACFVLFLFVGCADPPTALEPDLTASLAKPDKPPKPQPPGETAAPEISFAAACGRADCLWVVDADGENATSIYEGSPYLQSSWSDQGTGTAADPFVILVSPSGAFVQSLDKIEVVVQEGVPVAQTVTVLSTDAYHHAVVRPGGSEFAALQRPATLVVGNMDTGATVPLYEAEVGREIGLAAWNTDGTRLAFLVEDEWPQRGIDVMVMEVPVGDEGWVETAISWEWVDWGTRNLSWARTSNRLLLDVELQLYAVDLDVPPPEMGASLGEGSAPSWSEDDSRLVVEDDGWLWIREVGAGNGIKVKRGSWPDWRR